MRYMLILFILLGLIHASEYNEKGMKIYKKNCKSCHGSGDYGASQLEEAEWEDYFLFNASKLKKVHTQESEVLAKIEKFSKKKRQNLEAFLVENAKDSGSVGGCDGNRCGVQSGAVLMK